MNILFHIPLSHRTGGSHNSRIRAGSFITVFGKKGLRKFFSYNFSFYGDYFLGRSVFILDFWHLSVHGHTFLMEDAATVIKGLR